MKFMFFLRLKQEKKKKKIFVTKVIEYRKQVGRIDCIIKLNKTGQNWKKQNRTEQNRTEQSPS